MSRPQPFPRPDAAAATPRLPLSQQALQTLREPTVDQLEQELIDLGLHEYCKPALDKLRAGE